MLKITVTVYEDGITLAQTQTEPVDVAANFNPQVAFRQWDRLRGFGTDKLNEAVYKAAEKKGIDLTPVGGGKEPELNP